MTHQYIRVPPDSTGKKVFHKVEVLLNYNNGTIDFSVGETVRGVTSGLFGTILKIDGTTSTGALHVLLDIESPEQVVNGENLQIDSVTYATVNGVITESYHIPQIQIQGANDTRNSTYVDQYGSLLVRGKDGHFSFDALGNTNSEGNIVLGSHDFKYSIDSEHHTVTLSGAGTVTHNIDIPAAVFSTGLTSGDRAQYSTDRYFIHDPGHSAQIAIAGWIGDTGKENVVRKWGYFDDDEGVWFELNGTTLYTVVKNSNGTEVRTPQSQWNGDRLDGSGGYKNLSEYDLDITKTNIYIIEWQNAVGYVFFKVLTSQGIVVVHTFPMVNYFSGTVTGKQLLHLPFRAEQYNTGIAASTSELYLVGYVLLQSTSEFNVNRDGKSIEFDNISVTDTSYHALATIRMNKKQVVHGSVVSGIDNRSIAVPQDIQVFVSGGPVSIAAVINPTLNGSETWSVSASNLEFDVTADYTNLGKVVQYNIVNGGEVWRFDHLPEGGGIRENSPMLHRKADINAEPMLVGFAAKKLSTNAKVSVTISWYELGT